MIALTAVDASDKFILEKEENWLPIGDRAGAFQLRPNAKFGAGTASNGARTA
jgi:hypothetical protein